MNVIVTPPAEVELDNTYNYITNTLFNPQAAERLMDKIQEAITNLSVFPYSGPAIPNEPFYSNGFRKLLVENQIIIYKVFEELQEVHILHVSYAKSDYLSYL